MYSGDVGDGVGTRSHMCRGGWEVWVHGVTAIISMSMLIIIKSIVLYYVCVEHVCTLNTSPIHMYCTKIYKSMESLVYVIGTLNQKLKGRLKLE